MEQLNLKYTYVDGRVATDFMLHDGVDARYVKHPDGKSGWYDRAGVMVSTDATEAGQKPKGDLGEHPTGDQGGDTTEASGGNRPVKSRKKPQAQS